MSITFFHTLINRNGEKLVTSLGDLNNTRYARKPIKFNDRRSDFKNRFSERAYVIGGLNRFYRRN
jgi:hypothetical protein